MTEWGDGLKESQLRRFRFPDALPIQVDRPSLHWQQNSSLLRARDLHRHEAGERPGERPWTCIRGTLRALPVGAAVTRQSASDAVGFDPSCTQNQYRVEMERCLRWKFRRELARTLHAREASKVGSPSIVRPMPHAATFGNEH